MVRVEQHGRRVLPVHPLAEHVRRRAVDVALTNLLEARHFEDCRHRVGAALDVDGVGGVAAHARDAHQFAERREPLLVLAVGGFHNGLDVGWHARFAHPAHCSDRINHPTLLTPDRFSSPRVG